MQVRRAVVSDAAAIAEVHTASWQVAYEHVFGADRLAAIDVDARRAMWEGSLARGVRDVHVAVDEAGRIVGLVGTGPSRDADAAGELGEIYVLPEVAGTGVGHALMTAAVEAMTARGFGDAILWVLDDNPRARAFYEREGWTADGATKTDEFLGVPVTEVRYRRALNK